ncbi:MAG: DUF1963 domain-containing protein [Lachnospiraceae bacterium]|nr:DUF1963 domain-containing protein [Lachnospiraceae bacterium]
MSNIIEFEEVDNLQNVLRIGGISLLPKDMEWPVNPNGEKMTLILSIPTNFLNDILNYNYPKDKIISVFTTYNTEDYFLDSIVYHGDREELNNIKKGFTKVILHDIGEPRNDSEYLIPAQKLIVGNEVDVTSKYGGSLIGGNPFFLQNEDLEIASYQFCMQLYGADFPEEFQDIFYLNDSIGYLYLNKETDINDIGIFFTQCS